MKDYADEKYYSETDKFNCVINNEVRYTDIPLTEDRTFVKSNGSEAAVYTSTGGTVTGMPKTVVTAAYSLNIGARKTAEKVFIEHGRGYRDDDIAFSLAVFTYGSGYNYTMHEAIVSAQMKLVILPLQILHLFPAVMSEFEVTFFLTVPTIYKKIVANKESAKFLFRSCRYAITVADTMPQSLRKEIESILPQDCLLFDIYAMTEFACVSAPSNSRPLTTGRYLIKDLSTNKFLGVGEKGELLIDSKHTMIEYLGEGDKSDAFIFIDGKKYLRSGDVGYIDGKGIFHFVDRIKRTEKIAGHSIFLAEIEEEISLVENVKDCTVARKKGKNNKVFLCAYLQTEDKTDFGKITEEIKERILSKLNKFCLPQKFVSVDKIVKTSVGKNDFKYYEALDD
jgi:acyl-coenzyme A synthetase/AMP-(fatty) acid ligase